VRPVEAHTLAEVLDRLAGIRKHAHDGRYTHAPTSAALAAAQSIAEQCHRLHAPMPDVVRPSPDGGMLLGWRGLDEGLEVAIGPLGVDAGLTGANADACVIRPSPGALGLAVAEGIAEMVALARTPGEG
jgi:hypothetical protein